MPTKKGGDDGAGEGHDLPSHYRANSMLPAGSPSPNRQGLSPTLLQKLQERAAQLRSVLQNVETSRSNGVPLSICKPSVRASAAASPTRPGRDSPAYSSYNRSDASPGRSPARHSLLLASALVHVINSHGGRPGNGGAHGPDEPTQHLLHRRVEGAGWDGQRAGASQVGSNCLDPAQDESTAVSHARSYRGGSSHDAPSGLHPAAAQHGGPAFSASRPVASTGATLVALGNPSDGPVEAAGGVWWLKRSAGTGNSNSSVTNNAKGVPGAASAPGAAVAATGPHVAHSGKAFTAQGRAPAEQPLSPTWRRTNHAASSGQGFSGDQGHPPGAAREPSLAWALQAGPGGAGAAGDGGGGRVGTGPAGGEPWNGSRDALGAGAHGPGYESGAGAGVPAGAGAGGSAAASRGVGLDEEALARAVVVARASALAAFSNPAPSGVSAAVAPFQPSGSGTGTPPTGPGSVRSHRSDCSAGGAAGAPMGDETHPARTPGVDKCYEIGLAPLVGVPASISSRFERLLQLGQPHRPPGSPDPEFLRRQEVLLRKRRAWAAAGAGTGSSGGDGSSVGGAGPAGSARGAGTVDPHGIHGEGPPAGAAGGGGASHARARARSAARPVGRSRAAAWEGVDWELEGVEAPAHVAAGSSSPDGNAGPGSGRHVSPPPAGAPVPTRSLTDLARWEEQRLRRLEVARVAAAEAAAARERQEHTFQPAIDARSRKLAEVARQRAASASAAVPTVAHRDAGIREAGAGVAAEEGSRHGITGSAGAEGGMGSDGGAGGSGGSGVRPWSSPSRIQYHASSLGLGSTTPSRLQQQGQAVRRGTDAGGQGGGVVTGGYAASYAASCVARAASCGRAAWLASPCSSIGVAAASAAANASQGVGLKQYNGDRVGLHSGTGMDVAAKAAAPGWASVPRVGGASWVGGVPSSRTSGAATPTRSSASGGAGGVAGATAAAVARLLSGRPRTRGGASEVPGGVSRGVSGGDAGALQQQRQHRFPLHDGDDLHHHLDQQLHHFHHLPKPATPNPPRTAAAAASVAAAAARPRSAPRPARTVAKPSAPGLLAAQPPSMMSGGMAHSPAPRVGAPGRYPSPAPVGSVRRRGTYADPVVAAVADAIDGAAAALRREAPSAGGAHPGGHPVPHQQHQELLFLQQHNRPRLGHEQQQKQQQQAVEQPEFSYLYGSGVGLASSPRHPYPYTASVHDVEAPRLPDPDRGCQPDSGNNQGPYHQLHHHQQQLQPRPQLCQEQQLLPHGHAVVATAAIRQPTAQLPHVPDIDAPAQHPPDPTTSFLSPSPSAQPYLHTTASPHARQRPHSSGSADYRRTDLTPSSPCTTTTIAPTSTTAAPTPAFTFCAAASPPRPALAGSSPSPRRSSLRSLPARVSWSDLDGRRGRGSSAGGAIAGAASIGGEASAAGGTGSIRAGSSTGVTGCVSAGVASTAASLYRELLAAGGKGSSGGGGAAGGVGRPGLRSVTLGGGSSGGGGAVVGAGAHAAAEAKAAPAGDGGMAPQLVVYEALMASGASSSDWAAGPRSPPASATYPRAGAGECISPVVTAAADKAHTSKGGDASVLAAVGNAAPPPYTSQHAEPATPATAPRAGPPAAYTTTEAAATKMVAGAATTGAEAGAAQLSELQPQPRPASSFFEVQPQHSPNPQPPVSSPRPQPSPPSPEISLLDPQAVMAAAGDPFAHMGPHALPQLQVRRLTADHSEDSVPTPSLVSGRAIHQPAATGATAAAGDAQAATAAATAAAAGPGTAAAAQAVPAASGAGGDGRGGHSVGDTWEDDSSSVGTGGLSRACGGPGADESGVLAGEGGPELARGSPAAVAGGGGRALGKRGREGSAGNAGREVAGGEAGGQRGGAWALRERHQAGADALGEAPGTHVASGGGADGVVPEGMQQRAREEGSSSVDGSGGCGGGGALGSLEALIARMGQLRAASHGRSREQRPGQGVGAVGARGAGEEGAGGSEPLSLSGPESPPPRHAAPLQQQSIEGQQQQEQVPASLQAWSPHVVSQPLAVQELVSRAERLRAAAAAGPGAGAGPLLPSA